MIWEKKALLEYSSSVRPKDSELALEWESFERPDFLPQFLWTQCFISKSVSMAKHRLLESTLPPAATATHTYIGIHHPALLFSPTKAASQNASRNFTHYPQKSHLFVARAVILRWMSFVGGVFIFVQIEKIIKTKKNAKICYVFSGFRNFLCFRRFFHLPLLLKGEINSFHSKVTF